MDLRLEGLPDQASINHCIQRVNGRQVLFGAEEKERFRMLRRIIEHNPQTDPVSRRTAPGLTAAAGEEGQTA